MRGRPARDAQIRCEDRPRFPRRPSHTGLVSTRPKPNFVGRAAHIANAGYCVSAAHRRRGIGRLLVEDSIRCAPLLGFDAVQFNLVFASNPARSLYEEMGWRVVGRLPRAVGGDDCLIYRREVSIEE